MAHMAVVDNRWVEELLKQEENVATKPCASKFATVSQAGDQETSQKQILQLLFSKKGDS